jgi:sRNA-binding protein
MKITKAVQNQELDIVIDYVNAEAAVVVELRIDGQRVELSPDYVTILRAGSLMEIDVEADPKDEHATLLLLCRSIQ